MALTELDDDQRYRALQSRDARFDGVFIVGVRTTGIYCRPSCPTPVHPLRKNVDFYPSAAAAQWAGLRACKRCRPDATPGSPEWNVRHDLVGRAMRMINHGFLDRHSVAELARELAVTERHLRRILIEVVGAPPLAVARAQRAQTARTLIETTAMKFTDVAFASGFSSLRQFNDTIRAVFAATPTELRAQRGDASTRSGTLSIRLPFRSPLLADYLVTWWEKHQIAGVSTVRDGAICTALRLANGTGEVSLRIRDEWVDCELVLEDVADLAAAVAQCRALLDLDADPNQIDSVLARIRALTTQVERLPGMRSMGSTDGFATLVGAVIGQLRSVAAARTMTSRLVALVNGEPEGALLPFPEPGQLVDLDMSSVGLTKRSIETVRAVAATFEGRTDELSPSGDRDALFGDLVAIKGIGPWTANYVAMRALAHPDIYLAGDLVADRRAEALGLDGDVIDSVSPWRSYLTHHLWVPAILPDHRSPRSPSSDSPKESS